MAMVQAEGPARKGPMKKMAKDFRSLEAEKGENGAWAVTHHFNNAPSEMHAFGAKEGKKLMAHMKEHLGITTAGPGASAAAAAPGVAEEEE
jgi:hypothetical protein